MDSTPSSPEAAAPAPLSKLPLAERMKALVVQYGAIGLCVFLGTFVVTFTGVLIALKLGIKIGDSPESTGSLLAYAGAAYLITAATKPVRIAITMAITPAVAAFLRRFRKAEPELAMVEPSSDGAPSAPGRQSQE